MRRWFRSAGVLTFLVASASSLFAPVAAADLYVGLGGGVKHTDGAAFQIAGSIHRRIELHYSLWHDGNSDQAAGIGYRFGSGRLTAVLGVAYIGRVTENLLRHEDAYIEVRFDVTDRFSCQVSHYSTVGDDRGENLLLCGMQWPLAQSGHRALVLRQ